MESLTPSNHAQLGCDYLDELLQALETNGWCFEDTFGIERKVSKHAEALGLPRPFDRPSKAEHETPQELQLWLRMHDPLTDSGRERIIGRIVYAPPPASTKAVRQIVYYPLDEREQANFREFIKRVKRELRRHGATCANTQPSVRKVPDGYYSPADIAKAMGVPEKVDAIRMALKRLLDENRLPDGAWMENSNPAKGQAKILYRLSSVRPLLARFETPDTA